MRDKIILLFLLATGTIFAQVNDSILVRDIQVIQNSLQQQQTEYKDLSSRVSNQQYVINKQRNLLADFEKNSTAQNKTIDSLLQLINTNGQNIKTNSQELGTKIQSAKKETNTKLSQIDDTIDSNKLYWLFGTLGTILLGGLMYFFLGKRIKTSQTDVEGQIRNTKKALEEESVKLDNKLVEVLDTQLKLKSEEVKTSTKSSETADHSLALKVADEIIRIQKNLGRMDDTTKGLKQLNSSVKRIQDNFAANGYELVEMLGKDYNEGMKVTANFIPSEDLETGKQVISRIIKPQVNYKSKMIQAAQIEVSIGE
jgi:hypothetical protein